MILAALVNGLALGAGYALLAVGWTVLLGAARLVNFAHGQLYMLGAFVTWFAISRFGLPYGVAVPVALVVVAVLGVVLQLLMTRMTLDQNIVNLMLVTLAFGYLLQGGAALLFGGDPQTIDSPLQQQDLALGAARFTGQDVLIVVLALAFYALTFVVLGRTDLGRMVRGVAEDPKLAQLYGIDAARVYLAVFVFSAVCAALAGAVVGPRSPILTSMGFEEVIVTFLVVVLAGVGNLVGGLVVAIGLGLFTAFFGTFFPPAYSTAAAFVVLLVVLVVRPQGLAARR
ncbi:branched-chain amino acid ABC transporter permease [Pseudonocardia halophobica]|uniref:Branched-chain amino acid ABC transporter permease n=1 Tax=Pseudonocardia halophobica TaxID=29401 RepID=A0A9W6L5B5_9PSEU|nr:branched-chain amino acid ABC transporter permease [Pseudonocardia halophobica]GLL13327.1 branched-chain amino acid ABC transporter permease [Pseudonocardia halophobica]